MKHFLATSCAAFAALALSGAAQAATWILDLSAADLSPPANGFGVRGFYAGPSGILKPNGFAYVHIEYSGFSNERFNVVFDISGGQFFNFLGQLDNFTSSFKNLAIPPSQTNHSIFDGVVVGPPQFPACISYPTAFCPISYDRDATTEFELIADGFNPDARLHLVVSDSPIPEPTAWAILIAGLSGVGVWVRRARAGAARVGA